MKKMLVYLLILLLFCGCARGVESCPAEEPAPEISEPAEEGAPKAPEEMGEVIPEGHYEELEEPVIEEVDITRKEPCDLQIANGCRVGDTMKGTYSWHFDNEDGTKCAIEACGMHPLEAKEYMPVLVMDGTDAELLFGAEEPDSVYIRCWPAQDWGNYEAEGETVSLNGMTFHLKNEGCVYEVTATWDRFSTWGGSASYTFCAAPLGVELHAEAVTDKGMTLVCTQSGGNPSGELQTGSAFWLERRDENGAWSEMPFFEAEPEADWAWTQEAWMIPNDECVRWEIDWEWLYGSLPDGIYRLGKEITDFRSTGNYDTYRIWSDNFAVAWVDE